MVRLISFSLKALIVDFTGFAIRNMDRVIMRLLVVLSGFLLCSANILSQQTSLQFRHLTIDEGLSNSQVVSVLQDYKGYMWIGTYDGLNKYDGQNFVVYRNVPKDSSSILGNIGYSFFEDPQKKLFIGSFEGLSLYDRDLDRFDNFIFDSKSALYRIPMSINKITGDSSSTLWIGTSTGLFSFNYHKNIVKHYSHDPNSLNSICNDFVKNVFVDSKGRLWISTQKGLDLMDCKTGDVAHVMHCATHGNSIKDIYQCTAVEDKFGNVWFGSNDGLFCLPNSGDNKKLQLVHYLNNPDDPNSLSHNYVVSLFVDDDNNLLVGTENGGINLFDRKSNGFTHIRVDDFNPKSLNNESIWAISQDRNKNLWVGTFGGGVNISVNNSDFIVHYKSLPGAPQSLGFNIVKGFFESRNGKIWVATDGGGLNLFDPNIRRFVRFNTTNSNINSNAILCLEQGDDEQIWMGTWAGGLVNYNPKNNVFRSFTTKNSDISDDNIHSIAKDKNGNLWLGSQNGGLIYFDVKGNKFTAYLPENSHISDRRVTVVKIDKNGLLYLGATNSLQIFDPVKNMFATFGNFPTDTNSISNNSVIDILIQNDTTVWVATGIGLNRFNPITRKFKRYYKSDGLPNNLIFGVALDDFGYLWVTTNNGICRFDAKSNSFRNYTKSDGLQGNSFTERSILKLKNGQIMAGGKNGFNIISPNKIPENKKVPEVIISDFHVFYQVVPLGVKGSPLKNQISETSKLTLSYKQSVLTFFFTVMDFTNPSRNQYAYMMEGFDNDWIFCGNKSEATYTNLSPGKYTFRVKGSNNDGVWNDKGTSIAIVVHPPFWQTIWFRTLTLITLVLFLYIFVKRRLAQARRVAKLLEVKVKERTRELEDASALLEENQEEIQVQKEELLAQRDSLEEVNRYLLEKQNLISAQNEELDKHRNSLELLVEERTQELELALYKAEESNRLKSSFLANMSHEIRTPMNAIIGFSSLVKDQDLNDGERESMIDAIRDSSHSLLVIINDILDLSKIQADQMILANKDIDLIKLLEDVYALFSAEAQAKKLSFKLNLNQLPNTFIVSADYVRLRQVVANLMSNAIKFTSNGEVELGVRSDDSILTVYVKDTGIGIPAHFGNSIFDRFTKIEDSKDVLYGGTGLGLAISKSLVELWNGKMWYESVENKGSVFYFTIPNINIDSMNELNRNLDRPIKSPRFPNLQDKTILIAEDQEYNFRLLSTYIRKTNAHVIWAHNGQEAVTIIKSTPVDLVFMDIKMPVMNGMDATRTIRGINPTIPIFAQTAYAYDEEIKEFLESGMNGYLTKPIMENELIDVLNKFSKM